MFILQTLHDFVNNPMGRGSNAIPSRNLIRGDLDNRFDLLFQTYEKDTQPKSRLSPMLTGKKEVDKKKKISLDIYRDNEEYYFHFKIPSEGPDRRNTYDVVFHFTYGDEKELVNDKNLSRYYVKFFSNSPSFTYTFAYAFNLYGLFVEQLAGKFRHEVLSNPPITRNPGEIISYEKTTYFAARYLLIEKRYLNKVTINAMAKPFKAEDFAKKIRNTDKIEFEIKQEDRRVQKEKDDEKRAEEKTRKNGSSDSRGTVSSKEKVKGITASAKKAKPLTTAKQKIAPKGKVKARKSSSTKIKPR